MAPPTVAPQPSPVQPAPEQEPVDDVTDEPVVEPVEPAPTQDVPLEPVVPGPDASDQPPVEAAPAGGSGGTGGTGGGVVGVDSATRVDPELSRSLVLSGAAALVLAVAGIAMVGWRRRQW